ncbi:sigma-54-dependent Fis family transcriptional regulator [bacterium SCSIO 12696]|nr:sigma-54-dependent Fis family transcriptional regulator [bacterium SCSIO 12696]
MSSILVVEDEEIIRTSLCKLLTREGYQVSDARHIDDAIQQYRLSDFSLIISDLRLPGARGTELIEMASDVPVLIMTSYASLRSAVDTMRMGAVDYIAKPYDHSDMVAAVKRILNKRNKPAANDHNGSIADTTGMVGDSAPMQQLFDIIGKVAPTDATVLICGETGTGKELVAKAIHQQSSRNQQPLICVNCAAIPETLIEAELFGYEKGAFTGASEARTGLVAAAHGGTLFLDEIGELPAEAQARLLRVLQEGEVRPIGSVSSRKVDVRLLAATHRNLKQLCQQGKFREDLYYRIDVVNLSVPALRHRDRDILKIAHYLLDKFSRKFHKTGQALSPEAADTIANHSWPGNVRQLENALQRAVILCNSGEAIEASLLGLDASGENHSSGRETNSACEDSEQSMSLEDYFTRFVMEHQDSMSETQLAQKLGISRKCLWERRQKLGIPRR